MSDFLPALITLAVIGAFFVYGYFTDPCRQLSKRVQPVHGETFRSETSHSGKIPDIG